MQKIHALVTLCCVWDLINEVITSNLNRTSLISRNNYSKKAKTKYMF